MAKKNSSKTVTKEAISSSQPRIITYTGWAGIDISNTPIDASERDINATPNSWMGEGQSDSKPKYLAIQNNLVTCSNGSIATRYETERLAPPPPNSELTGIAVCYEDYLYAAATTNGFDTLWRIPIKQNATEQDWQQIPIVDYKGEYRFWKISSIQIFVEKLIVLVDIKDFWTSGSRGELFRGDLSSDYPDLILYTGVSNEPHVDDPSTGMIINSVGEIHSPTDEGVSRLRFIYTITNPFGSTLQSDPTLNNVIVPGQTPVQQADVYTKLAISQFDSAHYITLNGDLSGQIPKTKDIGVDLYVSVNESNNYIFIGHAEVKDDYTWNFNWLGTMMDSTQLTMSSIKVPVTNTTDGVDATHMDQYDGRLYFYGGSKKYRLYIGGNPGSELSVATGLGGAFVDIEQGSGQEIRKVLKFKTYNGATTITLLTHHHNTNRSARYNLVEDSIQVSNEYSTSGFHAEKVDSVIGTSSYYGADTFIDGLYAVSRYGVYFTTKTQENQNNLRMMYCSDAIEPIFTSLLGYQISGARLLCIKDTVYLLLSQYDEYLDDFLFCYDTTTKAWSTRTIFNIRDNQPNILHMFHIDSMNYQEGIGLITKSKPGQRNGGIYLLPTTGNELDLYYQREHSGIVPIAQYPEHTSYFETHNLATRIPITNLFYLLQIEFYFDYLCAPYNEKNNQHGLDLWVEGYDYHGRHFKVAKNVIENSLTRKNTVFLRVDRYIESFKLFIKGKAHYRLTHFNVKCYQQSSSINTAYGHDSWIKQKKQHGVENFEHHQLDSYNNLKEIIMT